MPLAHYEAPDGLLTLLRANPDRKFVLTGEEDQTLSGIYGIYPRGLTLPLVDAKPVLPTSGEFAARPRMLSATCARSCGSSHISMNRRNA